MFPLILALASATLATVPHSMLSDIIDYDELQCGQRREGMYVVLETTITQLMDIVAGSIPNFVLALLGYVNNGGCTCGCGVRCENYFQRWSCPGDIGYACSGSLGKPQQPFFGEPSRHSPCTEQPYNVQRAIHIQFLGLPAILILIAASVLLFSAIDSTTQKAIVEQTRLRR